MINTRLYPVAGHSLWVCTAMLMLASVPAGCTRPLDREMEQALREQTLASQRAYDNAVRHARDVELTRPAEQVTRDMPPERVEELETMSGLRANERVVPMLGTLLTDERDVQTVVMTLERCIQLTLENNHDLKIARLVPALRETQITQAEAVFDATFFSEFNFQKLDTPQPPSPTAAGLFGTVQQDTRELTTGIRKLMSTGGEITASTNFGRNFRDPTFFGTTSVSGTPPVVTTHPINSYYDTDISLSVRQPLLRNFGADVTRSQIVLARNARDQALSDLKQSTMDRLVDVEQAYWTLVFARERMLSAQRIVERSTKNRTTVEGRAPFDATSLNVAQVRSSVAEREFDMVEARTDYFQASDQLKVLMNSPELPVASEMVIVPLDRMIDAPLSFNLSSAIRTALRQRPDVKRSLSEISDASIRQRVADNQRLPVLDLVGTARWQGISVDNIEEAYDNTMQGDFIDYIVGIQFEAPIGNRGPNALWQQRKIERTAAVIAYQRTTQNAVAEVKASLRALQSAYHRIGSARQARLASAEVVRGLEAQVDAQVQLTPPFINTVIQGDEDLFQNEIREVQALAEYNTAVAQYYRAVGTLLEHNGVEFSPEPERK